MNVLMVSNDSEILREGSAARERVMQQAREVNRLMVIVMNSSSTPAIARKVTDTLWIFPTNSSLPFLKIMNALYIVRHEFLFRNRFQADVIVANDPMTAGLLGYLIAFRFRKPFNIHMGYNPLTFAYARRSLTCALHACFAFLMVRYALTLTVTHESTERSVTHIYRAFTGRVIRIPRYLDIDAIQAEEPKENIHAKYPQFRAIILVVADLSRDSNLEIPIRCVKQLSEYYSNIGALFVGDGKRRRHLQHYARSLGIENQIVFEHSREDMMSYYKTAYMLMIPSLNDAFETTIENAAAAGCPIITANVGIASMLIENGKNGYLCDPNAPAEFWAAAGTLIRNPAVRTSVKQNILASMQTHMSSDKDSHVHLYIESWGAAIKASQEK